MVANSPVSMEFSFNRKMKFPEEGVLCYKYLNRR